MTTDDLGLADELNASAKAIIDFARSEHTPARIFGYATERLWHIANLAALRSPSAVREALERAKVDLEAALVLIELHAGESALGLRQTIKIVEAALASSPVVGRTITDQMVKAGAAAMCCQAERLGCAAKNADSEFSTCMLSTFMEDARRCLIAALPTPPRETKDAAASTLPRPHHSSPVGEEK